MSQTAAALVIEDNDVAREALVQILSNEGYEVHEAVDGVQGLAYLRNQLRPDVILLDMHLPGLDGWRFLEEMRNLSLSSRPWIIVTTGSQAISREWAAAHGCAGFLHKPIMKGDLLKELRRCLSQTIEMAS